MHAHDHNDSAAPSPAAYWEERYAAAPVWSGRVNRTLADVLDGLEPAPGTALDLGCGEGADALWLAERGWRVTAVDIAPSAIARASAAARAAGVDENNLRYAVVDLDAPGELEREVGAPVDLVTASFFHSPVELDRITVLRRAARLVAPGGHLFILTHAAPPAWASGLDHVGHRFLTPDEEFAALGLDASEWTALLTETRARAATAPDGTPTELLDGVLLLRRTGQQRRAPRRTGTP